MNGQDTRRLLAEMQAGSRHAAIRLHMEDVIERVGWMVQGVFPTEQDPGPLFCYTIGLHDKGLPELLVFGLPPQIGQTLLNDIAQVLMVRKEQGQRFTGRFEHPRWPLPFVIAEVPVADAVEYATFAEDRSGGRATYLQVFWPDKNGKYHWDQGVLPKHVEGQPMLAKSIQL